jgi:NAD(P)-dependent dehydrogenase (short-subunit alcohol dehydrogenase family)
VAVRWPIQKRREGIRARPALSERAGRAGIGRVASRVWHRRGAPDVFVSNARPELPAFYRSPLELTLEQWRAALDTQARAFLLGVQEAARLMPDGGRIVAVTYAPGGRTGSWQPWAAMGAAKAALGRRWCATSPWR